MLRIVLLFVGCGMLLVGCASQVPIATTYPASTQRKAKAAHHWDVLADIVARQTMGVLAADDSLTGRSVYVLLPPDRTPFNQAFRNFLITRLVNRDIQVSDRPDGAVTVQYETQLVRHGGNGSGGGALNISPFAGLSIRSLVGGSASPELLVTTTILDGGRYVMRRSDIYYLEESDLELFTESKGRKFDVSATERPVKQWEVVGQ